MFNVSSSSVIVCSFGSTIVFKTHASHPHKKRPSSLLTFSFPFLTKASLSFSVCANGKMKMKAFLSYMLCSLPCALARKSSITNTLMLFFLLLFVISWKWEWSNAKENLKRKIKTLFFSTPLASECALNRWKSRISSSSSAVYKGKYFLPPCVLT